MMSRCGPEEEEPTQPCRLSRPSEPHPEKTFHRHLPRHRDIHTCMYGNIARAEKKGGGGCVTGKKFPLGKAGFPTYLPKGRHIVVYRIAVFVIGAA